MSLGGFELKPTCIFCGSNDNVFESAVDLSLVVSACVKCSGLISNKAKIVYYCRGCGRASLYNGFGQKAVITPKCQRCQNKH